ncbi:MAG: DUF3465 domain-containing protein [Erysipelotrichia bacterium]|nr:DUF3465 domain-containing protein [Erysipelotrichia bacterium]
MSIVNGLKAQSCAIVSRGYTRLRAFTGEQKTNIKNGEISVSKSPPELTWQDKAILVAIPVVVFTIFILANYFSQDLTVNEAFQQELAVAEVRDGGSVIQIYPQVATDSVSCRLKTRESNTEFDFVFQITASETIKFEVGRLVQFYGQYKHSPKGGTVTSPYKGKSGRMSGWAIYENHRYSAKEEADNSL